MRQLPSLFYWFGAVIFVGLSAGASVSAQALPLPTSSAANPPAAIPSAASQIDATELLLKQVDPAIEVNSRRDPIANAHSPWQIFHGILALRKDFLVKLGDQKISAIQWIATAETKFDNEPLIIVTPHGANFHPFSRPYAFQGHPAQFLALLSQSDLPMDFKFRAEGRDFTIADILRDTMMSVNSSEEVTWVLWALNHYLKSDARWMNKFGEPWSIERMVQMENHATVERAACGGNHGLFAISRARDKYLKSGQPLRGTWLEADQKIKRYAEIARSMQNGDGSFSANFYKGPEFSADINIRLNTTGHTLEFLAASLPTERLHEPWVRNAVQILSKDLFDHRQEPVDCGPLYHSLNALMIYRDRVRTEKTPQLTLKPASEAKALPPPEPMPPVVEEKTPDVSPPAGVIDGPLSALEPANVR